jgi:hypothetical protein
MGGGEWVWTAAGLWPSQRQGGALRVWTAASLCSSQRRDAVQAMVIAGEITQEQARLHRQLRLNSFKMSLLALEGISDIALERTLDGLGRVVRRFYGV